MVIRGLLLSVSGTNFGACLGLLGGCWGLFGTVWGQFGMFRGCLTKQAMPGEHGGNQFNNRTVFEHFIVIFKYIYVFCVKNCPLTVPKLSLVGW